MFAVKNDSFFLVLQFVVSGSDDFRVYIWKVPSEASQKSNLFNPQDVPGQLPSLQYLIQGWGNFAGKG